MKIRISASLTDIDNQKRGASIHVKQELDNPLVKHFIAEFYEAILKAMRDYDEEMFDMAMGAFVENDYDRLIAKVERELHNEN